MGSGSSPLTPGVIDAGDQGGATRQGNRPDRTSGLLSAGRFPGSSGRAMGVVAPGTGAGGGRGRESRPRECRDGTMTGTGDGAVGRGAGRWWNVFHVEHCRGGLAPDSRRGVPVRMRPAVPGSALCPSAPFPSPTAALPRPRRDRGGRVPCSRRLDRLRSHPEGPVEIIPKIFGVLDSHAEPDERRRQMFLSGEDCPPLHRRLHASQAGSVADQPHLPAHPIRQLSPAP